MMTFHLQVGQTQIPYQVRYSRRAKRKRVVVRPDHVEVVAPEGTPLEGSEGIFAFVEGKRRWLFDARRELAHRQSKLSSQRWASGAKVQYRGRWLMLDIKQLDVQRVEISCHSKFHLRVPQDLVPETQSRVIKETIESWLRARAQRDVIRFARRHQKRLGVQPQGICLSDQKHAWGTCGHDQILRIHWRLIQAPAAAMEYVVAHEVCHLLHRNHSETFWMTLASTLPNWAEGKQLLERWETEHRAV